MYERAFITCQIKDSTRLCIFIVICSFVLVVYEADEHWINLPQVLS